MSARPDAEIKDAAHDWWSDGTYLVACTGATFTAYAYAGDDLGSVGEIDPAVVNDSRLARLLDIARNQQGGTSGNER